jgi:hypothetical protein
MSKPILILDIVRPILPKARLTDLAFKVMLGDNCFDKKYV